MVDMMAKLFIRHIGGLMFVLLNIEEIFVELKNFNKNKLSKIFLKFKFFMAVIF